jgi:hypothetical protein
MSDDYATKLAKVTERMDYVQALIPGEREAMKRAWVEHGCTHEFPEDQRIAWCCGWAAARAYIAEMYR